MKTPREVLFQRHHSAEAKLDHLRQHVVAGLATDPSTEVEAPRRTSLLRNWILPLRWHLAGLSVSWLIVAFLNVDRTADGPGTQQTHGPPRYLLTELQENRRRIFELVDAPVAEPATIAPNFIPRPRSAIESRSAVV
jgi:hypothetical protein